MINASKGRVEFEGKGVLKMKKHFCLIFVVLALACLLCARSEAQQTLGSINGTVTDSTGAVVQNADVKAHNVATGLEQTAKTKSDGSFNIIDLPIGTYEVTFSREGFKKEVHSQILVQGNRTTTVNGSLQPGEVSAQIIVSSTPLLNQTDTTNGYTLSSDLIESVPLGTGSFTQLAILAPGVNADLLNGSGTNAGLGNQDIFANGQRDTSNSISFNGINANNVFNGKTSSQVSANRFVLSTGEHFLAQGGDIQTSTSVYNAIGEGLPTPPPEIVEEMHVNTSMYDASQGANSGAHIDLQQKSGSNDFHGQIYEYHQTSAWNAAPFFRNADPSIAPGDKVPSLHYNRFGGTLSGPVVASKMFFFGSYQGVRTTDQLNATSFLSVPVGLGSDRSNAGLVAAANSFIDPSGNCGQTGHPACFTGTINPIAAQLLSAKLPGGGFAIPSATITDPTAAGTLGHDVVLQGPPATFAADQASASIDYNFSPKDRLAGKYYFQNDPTTSPFAASQTIGFPQRLRAGSQVYSIDNTTVLTPSLTWEQRFGFIREIAFATTSQPFAPSTFGVNVFSNKFPGIFIVNPDNVTFNNLGIGPAGDQATFANAGVFQNQFEWGSNVNAVRGRQTFSVGFNLDHNQLNVVNQNNSLAKLEFFNFLDFLTGTLRADTPEHTVLFNGSSNRYFRSNQVGTYVQDNIKLRSNLSVNLGVRWDWDGALNEKNGFLTNFYRKNYSYSLGTDTISNIGLVVAGSNKAFGTKGVSSSTLTGRQWLFEPRIGVVWSPSLVKNFVVRAGFGLYADRGEFFTEFSPSAGFGFNGPFGVTLEPPFIVPCVPGAFASGCGAGANKPTFANPFGTAAPPPPPSNLSSVAALVPNQAGLTSGTQPLLFGGYDPANKLPYSENWQLDFQWQPWNTVMMTLAYVGNHGLNETLPIPFNQPGIATSQNPINGQTFSFGYQAVDSNTATCPTAGPPNFTPCPLQTEQINTSTGGNTDLRVPFIGYSPNSVFYEAEGISHYNALEFNLKKRLSQGLTINASYTWSHSLDEGSGLGLFYNGNNPLVPRSGYASSDFDRTHVFIVAYSYDLPKLARATGAVDKLVNGWGLSGITTLESGQPYNVYDFSGSVAGIYYSANDFITNPVLPLVPGTKPGSAELQGTTGVNAGNPVLDVTKFTIPTPFAPGTNGVPPCGTAVNPNTGAPTGVILCDNFETGFGTTGRNIFRGPFQTRFDFSVAKKIKLTEKFSLRYDAQFFNIFNHPSFDTPNNNVTLNPCFNPTPCYSVPAPPSQNLGIIQHTLGSPRFIQMALHLTF